MNEHEILFLIKGSIVDLLCLMLQQLSYVFLNFFYLFGVCVAFNTIQSHISKRPNYLLGRFENFLGFETASNNITMGSWKGRGYQYIQLVKVLYCKLPTNGKQLPAFPLEAGPGTEPGLRNGRRECYHSPPVCPQLSCVR